MVLNFYKVAEPPFGVTPDPEFLYLGKTHREALASLLHGLTAGRGFTALIAGAGMGKTALLRLIVQKLQDSMRVAFLPHAHRTPRELLANLLTTLGAESADDSFLAMHSKLNEALVREHNAQKRFVVVIDEAQDLGEPALELLRVLSNVETPREKLLHFVLSGHPQLAEKLASPQLIQLRQRVSIIARLEPFDAEETRLYIDHRLRVAGYEFASPMFTPLALDLIADYSRGVPRNINNICFNALSLGFVKRQQPIDVDVIHEVLEDLDLQKVIEAGGEVPFVPKSRRDDPHLVDVASDPNSPERLCDFLDSSDVTLRAAARTGEPQREYAEALAASPSTSSQARRGADLRRSSRIVLPVSLLVLGTDRMGESFQEATSAVSVNLHGCRFSSRREPPVGGWVTLQIGDAQSGSAPRVRAQVRSVFSPESLNEPCQVGVELETPANIWGVTSPPHDWRSPKEPELPVTESVARSLAQILPVLEERLQQSADHFAQTAVESRLAESLRGALAQIEDFWKVSASQREEISVARMADMRQRWEEELAVHRNHFEETSTRLELLGSKAGQGLLELQRFVTRIKGEIEPQFDACLNQSLLRAASEFETIANHVSERHHADLIQASQESVRESRSRVDETVESMRSLVAATPASIPEERVESLIGSSRELIVRDLDQRLAEVYGQLDQQQEQARRRAEEFSLQLERMTSGLRESQDQNQQSISDIRSWLASREPGVSQQHLDSQIRSERDLIFNHFESKLNEVSSSADQQQELARQRTAEITQQIEGMTAKADDLNARHAQSVAELGALIAGVTNGPSEERINRLLANTREQLVNHIESRLSEFAGLQEQRQNSTHRQLEELSLGLEQLASETRTRLLETRDLVERASGKSDSESLELLDQSAKRALHEIENTAIRVSDRQLVRMTEQKQTLARELALELEARASETRAIIEKSANSALEEFRRHLELQNELIIGDTTQRISSTLASLDAEYRSVRDTHHQTLKAEVAQAAEQSLSEFRSGMKAFLYSCLVAAVSAVDQHAQTTLNGLSNDPNEANRKLDSVSGPVADLDKRSSAAGAK